MPTSTALVATARPGRYVKQLVSHFGTKVETETTDEGGLLVFDFGRCRLVDAGSALRLVATAADEAQLETLRDVVGRHLVRFGAADELVVSWDA